MISWAVFPEKALSERYRMSTRPFQVLFFEVLCTYTVACCSEQRQKQEDHPPKKCKIIIKKQQKVKSRVCLGSSGVNVQPELTPPRPNFP